MTSANAMTTQSARPVRVYVIDDHAIMRVGVREVLREIGGAVEFVGEAGDCRAAVAGAAESRPDVILLDLDLGTTSGVELIPELRQAAPASRILILTGLADEAEHLKAYRAGALGLVLKGKAMEELAPAIAKVSAGDLWFDKTLVRNLLDHGAATGAGQERGPEADKIRTLTAQERVVVSLVGEGLRNRQIGERLSIAEGTVKQHLSTIFDKLGVPDRFGLIMYAYRHNLARPPV